MFCGTEENMAKDFCFGTKEENSKEFVFLEKTLKDGEGVCRVGADLIISSYTWGWR